jgi:CRISPR-associated endonuclease Csn1
MKHIIGLDAGTNSIGWSLVSENDGEINLVDIGTTIFPIGTILDDKSNKETTKNEKRRIDRGTKRNYFRYKMRRKKLKGILSELGMLPDFTELDGQKNEYQSYNLYKMRSKAIKEIIPLEEIGRIFLILNKYRGFASNAKKLSKTTAEDGLVKGGINELNNFIAEADAKTIGEYFYLMHEKAISLYKSKKWHNPNELIDERAIGENGEIILSNSRGIRRQFGRYTAREMYKKEFDLIWETQKTFYMDSHPSVFTGSLLELEKIKAINNIEIKNAELSKFKKTNYWRIRNACIYYQRPLKSQKKYVSNCQFEKNKKVTPTSNPLYQEFRIWKNISDLRYCSEVNGIYNKPLPLEWKVTLASFLEIHDKMYISVPKKKKDNDTKHYLKDILSISDSNITFTSEGDDSEKYIKGNTTYFAMYQALGAMKYEELQNSNTLAKLWQNIYMAKDDEWLKDTLIGRKWNFNNDMADRIIEYGYEEEYGAYSTKVITKILPYMKNGHDEYTSLVLAGYLKSPDEIGEDIKLSPNISQLKYQELRNPVVEKAVSQAIIIVNNIIANYTNLINQDELEIHVESTREFKKPRKEREKLLRDIREKDELRQEYADFLNRKKDKGELLLSKRIEKYDSIISKFELWLEMGMDKDDPTFIEFEKVTRKGDKEKHKLWLECNRICPYTEKVISLTRLFSADIEIEHIIPLSRSLDDSFSNKTITFSHVNREKGNRTAFEYMKWKDDIDHFRKRINQSTNMFSDAKKDNFLAENIENVFSHNQLSNTGYIAKYIRKKMMEICRTVYFTTGMATSELRKNDWKLFDLLDKIRYEEETGVEDIDVFINKYSHYQRLFRTWYKNSFKTTDINISFKTSADDTLQAFATQMDDDILGCIEKVNNFLKYRNKANTTKDRSDHRNHAIDAFITACCTPGISSRLSSLNRAREEHGIPLYNEYGRLSRDLIEQPFDYFELKSKIKEILVCHRSNSDLISSCKNKSKSRNGIIEQRTYSPQGALHKDGFYGKLKKPHLQNIDKNNAFVKRIPLLLENQVAFSDEKDLAKIYDSNVKEILANRIRRYGSGEKAFSSQSLENDPIYMYSLKEFPEGTNISKKGNMLPTIKNVRVLNKNSRNLINLPAKDETGKIINGNRYTESASNYIIVYYEYLAAPKKGKATKALRSYKIYSFFNAVQNKRTSENKKMFPDEIEIDEKFYGLKKDCTWLKQGDMVVLFTDSFDKERIDWNNKKDIAQRLFVVKQIGESVTVNKKYGEYYYGNVGLLRADKSSKNMRYNSGKFKKGITNFSCSHIDLNAIKVRVSPLGNIVPE